MFFRLLRFVGIMENTYPNMVTPLFIKKVGTRISASRAEELAKLINHACYRYGVTTFTQLDEPLANLFQESLEFVHKMENMNYKAETLTRVWPSRFPTLASAIKFQRQPEKLANYVYGGRMGNVKPGDGWLFRGGGYIGLTGREVYSKYADYLKRQVEDIPDLVRSSDYVAMDSAFWFMYVLRGLKQKAEENDFIGIVKSINGGTVGLKDRLFYYERINGINSL